MQRQEIIIFKKSVTLLNIVLLFAFLIDRLIKWLALNFWQSEGFFVLGRFWENRLFKNYHLSFSLPISYPLNLTIIIPIFLVVIYFLIKAYQKNNFWLVSSFSLVALGALSNLIDRLRYGFVIDFINWHFGLTSYPAFNLADIFIVTGIIIMLIGYLTKKKI